jgi:hypothetical protein
MHGCYDGIRERERERTESQKKKIHKGIRKKENIFKH